MQPYINHLAVFTAAKTNFFPGVTWYSPSYGFLKCVHGNICLSMEVA